MSKKKTTEEFIKECILIHGNKYSYEKVDYQGANKKVCIICPKHGEFWQVAVTHITNHNCPKCGINNRNEYNTKTLDQFIIDAKKIHGDKYNYNKSIYTKAMKKIIIICSIHGEFSQTANDHLSGYGCPFCAIDKKRTNTEEFIIKSRIIHKNKYDYSKTHYIDYKNKVIIICPIHGEFKQLTSHHLQGNGCPICSSSKGELLIYNWLKENKIPFKTQLEIEVHKVARNSNLIRIDFFVKYDNKQYFIEYDGIQHFEYINYFHKGGIIDFEKQQNRDIVLNEFCELHKDKVTLIRFNYFQNKEEILLKLNDLFK